MLFNYQQEKASELRIESFDQSSAPSILDFIGEKHLLILFFNIGCFGCIHRAFPIAENIKSINPELNVIGIHTNFEGIKYSDFDIKNVLDKRKYSFKIYKDIEQLSYNKFKAEGTPHWILVNKDGLIVKSIFGSMSNAVQRLNYSLLELLDIP